MSALATAADGARRTPATAPAGSKQKRQRHTPGGAGLGKEAGHEARRVAAAILEVLAGARTPSQAAEALGVSLPCYFQWETRAMHALIEGCEAKPRGRVPSAETELASLRRQHERLQRELARQQTLVRLAQRSIGLTPPRTEPVPAGSKSKQRRRKPVVRALRAAQQLQRASQEVPPASVPEVSENTTP
jgi:hypothetical protein